MFVHNMKSGVYHRGIKCSHYETMYGSLRKTGSNIYLPDGAILNSQTEEPEAGFTRTRDDDEENVRHTDKTDNEIMDDTVQEHDNMSFGTKRLRWSSGSVLAFGTQVRGFKPGRRRRIFQGEKNPQHVFLRKGSKAVCPMS